MAIQAISALKERGGSSNAAIAKYLKEHFGVEKVIPHLRQALARLVASGKLQKVKASFKLAGSGAAAGEEDQEGLYRC